MNAGKKLIAVAILIVAGVGLVYAMQNLNLKNAEKNSDRPDLVNGLLKDSVRHNGTTYLIPPNYVFDYGVDVPEINDPSYTTVAISDELIADDLPGIAIEVDGEQYFYPYQIMNWHQVVNADFDDLSLVITYDPLCYCDRVYEADDLQHSNTVYNNNALLTDSDGNLWSQSRGLAVAGGVAGEELQIYPSISMSWDDWKDRYPNGNVLEPRNDEPRDYTRHPLGAYDENDIIYFPLSDLGTGLGEKWIVDGFEKDGESIAFSREIEKGFGAYNATVADAQIVGFYDFDLEAVRVFDRIVDGDTFTFEYDFDSEEITDQETGSTWNADGLAIDGELEGTQLNELQTKQSFWMCWATAHDNAKIAHAENIERTPVEEGVDLELDL